MQFKKLLDAGVAVSMNSNFPKTIVDIFRYLPIRNGEKLVSPPREKNLNIDAYVI